MSPGCCDWVTRNERGEAILAKGPRAGQWVSDVADSLGWRYLVELLDSEGELTSEDALAIEEALEEAGRDWRR